MLRTKRVVGFAGLLACVVGLAACGSSGNSSTSTTTPKSSTTPTATTTTTAASALGAKHVATGSPVLVGQDVPSQGAGANLDIAPAQKAAVSYINNYLDGINGHPIKVIACQTDQTPSTVTTCGNTFVQKKVIAAFDGYDNAVGTMLPTLTSAGIPLIGQLSENSVANTDTKNSFYFATDESAIAIGTLQAFAAAGHKSIFYALPDVPVAHTYANDFLNPIATKLHMSFGVAYYSPASPNLSLVAATIKAHNPEIGGLSNSPSEQFCNQFIQSMRQAGYTGTVLASTCSQFLHASALKGQTSNVAMFSDVWIPAMAKYAPANIQTNLKTAQAALAPYVSSSQQGYYSFAIMNMYVTWAEAMTKLHASLTPSGIHAAMLKIKNFQTFLGGTDTCNRTIWPNSSACGNQLVVATSQTDGTLKPTTPGSMTLVKSSLLPKA